MPNLKKKLKRKLYCHLLLIIDGFLVFHCVQTPWKLVKKDKVKRVSTICVAAPDSETMRGESELIEIYFCVRNIHKIILTYSVNQYVLIADSNLIQIILAFIYRVNMQMG